MEKLRSPQFTITSSPLHPPPTLGLPVHTISAIASSPPASPRPVTRSTVNTAGPSAPFQISNKARPRDRDTCPGWGSVRNPGRRQTRHDMRFPGWSCLIPAPRGTSTDTRPSNRSTTMRASTPHRASLSYPARGLVGIEYRLVQDLDDMCLVKVPRERLDVCEGRCGGGQRTGEEVTEVAFGS